MEHVILGSGHTRLIGNFDPGDDVSLLESHSIGKFDSLLITN